MLKNAKLVWIRTETGLTQSKLADLVGVSRETYCRWECGKLEIPDRKLKRLLDTVQVDASKLPKELDYDAMGYPIGYSKASFEPGGANYVLVDENTYDDEMDILEKLEGKEYPERELWRRELFYRDAVASGRLTRETADKRLAEWRDILFGVDDLV